MSYEGVAPSGYIYHSTDDTGLHGFAKLAGDVSGILGDTLVERIRNVPVGAAGGFGVGQVFIYNGSEIVTSGIVSMSSAHEILSTTHSDTSTVVPKARGSILHVSGVSNLWAALPLGLNGQLPQSNGLDIIYDYLGANTPFKDGTLSAPSQTFVNDLDTGFSRPGADRLAASVSGTEYFRLDAPNGSISLLAGQIIKARLVSAAANITTGDMVVLCSGNGYTLTLTASPSGGQFHQIKDAAGQASVISPIVINGNGKNIDGNGTVQIRNSYGALTVIYNEPLARWNIL